MNTSPSPPTPDELQNQFHIPRQLLKHIAEWMDISESMLFQVVRQGRKPSSALSRKLQSTHSIPEELWEKPVDEVAKEVYSMWYEQLTPYQKEPTQTHTGSLEDLF